MLKAYSLALLHTKAHRAIRQSIAAALEPFEVTLLEWILLCSLDLENGIRLSQVADLLGVEAPLISQLLVSLQAKGLVKLTQDGEDRRAKRLVLTVNGHKIVLESDAHLQKTTDTLFQNLSLSDLEAHEKALATVIANLDS